jgi:hypothetical protein
MQQGWVKVHRKILESEVFQSDALFKFFMWCLLSASHKEHFVPIKTGRGETIVRLLPGQLIYGRYASARKLRCKPATSRNFLLKLKNMQILDTQHSTHFTIITIMNWNIYQNLEKNIDTDQDTQRTHTRMVRMKIMKIISL